MSTKENLRDAHAHGDSGNVLYLDHINVSILAVTLYYGLVRY